MDFVRMSDGKSVYSLIYKITTDGTYTYGKMQEDVKVVHLEDGWHQWTENIIKYYEEFHEMMKTNKYVVYGDMLSILNDSLIVCQVKSNEASFFCIFKDNKVNMLSFNEFHQLKRYTSMFEEYYWEK